MKKLVDLIRGFSGVPVAVLGDLMLDRYVCGHATRISQEAPVPVVQVQRQNNVPGGAANVARNILSLGGQTEVFGITGRDTDGKILKKLLQDAGGGVTGMVCAMEAVTTVKMRILASNQQIVRVDYEQPDQITESHRGALLERLENYLATGSCHALILEDYAKGIFTADFMVEIVRIAHRHGVEVALDPHPTHPFDVKGLKFMTPNRLEAFALAGMPFVHGIGSPEHDLPLRRVGEELLRRWEPEMLLITLGAEGIALYFRDGRSPVFIPTQARRVFDVSGAGDTVMATMALALSAGASPQEAAIIANHAAGVVVGYVGTRAIEAAELCDALKTTV
ncbi:MAG: D-glycero-beta-D-manno-heptose-7-phosphate kinase [Victivallales bacterium]|nr:D-glycero-beta-D-manno-heptose-7-phosphate kinase [Victivallales bacterium]